MTAAEQTPFKLVADVTAGTDTNAIQFNLKNGATDIAAATGMNTAAPSRTSTWATQAPPTTT